MLPFFRKIRWRLAANNQFFKYSRYAIGEIGLVVIGILIALYINNWNEVRKQREKFDQVLVEVEKELIVNINKSRNTLENLSFNDSIYDLIINNRLTVESYRNDSLRILSSPMAFYDEVVVSDNAFEKLSEIGGNLTPELDLIVNDLSLLYSDRQHFVEVISRQVHRVILENYETMFTNQPWYRNWQLKQNVNDSEVKYFLENEKYLNRAAYTSELSGSTQRLYIESFEVDARSCYRRVHEYLKSKNAFSNDTLLFTYDPSDYEHYVGKYIQTWSSTSVDYGIDSVVISIENNKLYHTPYVKGEKIDRREIIPIDRYNYRTELGRGFYRIIFDSNDSVVGIKFSNGHYYDQFEKIR